MKKWVTACELPESSRGSERSHVKVYSLLKDPTIRAELRSYPRTNKWTWSMDLAKLSEYVKMMSIAGTEKYVHNLVDEEMPH